MSSSKQINVLYFATLREQRGLSLETVETSARTPQELYRELQARHGLDLPVTSLKVAINDAFEAWDRPLRTADRVVFIPPVAGG